MSDADEFDTRTWPRTLKEVARLVGPRAAVDLAEKIGGVITDIPVKATPDHALAAVIGLDALAALVREYGGRRLYLARGVNKGLKRETVRRMKGSSREIALAAGVSQRYVHGVRALFRAAGEDPAADAEGEAPAQGTLF